jgi:hypothetical protein
MQLFGQPVAGDWDSVVQQVAGKLRRVVARTAERESLELAE